MSVMETTSPMKMARLEAVVIRADGTREDLGTIAFYHQNPLKVWWWKIKHKCASVYKRNSV